MDMDSSLHGTWLTMPFEKDGEGEFLEAGIDYYAGVQYWYDTDSLRGRRGRNLEIGGDRAIKKHRWSSGYSLDQIDWWYYPKEDLMIRLNINNNDNIIDGIPGSDALNALEQNYPNPFNKHTDINYSVASGTDVNIEVCDITGRKVLEINEGYKPAGKHKLTLNAESLSAGIYYYTLITNNYRDTKKMVISK